MIKPWKISKKFHNHEDDTKAERATESTIQTMVLSLLL
jgi:hypothetical protein